MAGTRKRLAPVDPDDMKQSEDSQIVPQAKASYRVTLGPRKTGRPTTLTPEVIEAMSNLLAVGLSIPVAAQAMGIPRDTWRTWNKRGSRDHARGVDSNFAEWWEATNEAKASVEVTLISRVVMASLHDWKAAAWIAERRWPERWQTPDKRPGKNAQDDLATKSTAELHQMLADAKGGKLLPSASAAERDDSDQDEELDESEDFEDDSPDVIDVVSTSTDDKD